MKHKVCSVTSEPTQSSSRRVSSLKDPSVLLKLNGELHKSEDLLITSTLLVLKTENIYQNTSKMHMAMETEFSL